MNLIDKILLITFLKMSNIISILHKLNNHVAIF
jgi:hypothetical protein